MAEEKKEVKRSIRLQKLADKSVKEFTEAVADPAGKPGAACAAAVVAAMTPALGSLTAAGLAPEQAEKLALVKQEFDQMRSYMVKQIDELPRSYSPLHKRLAEGAEPEMVESAARVACGIPNELVYTMCHSIELLDQLADVCRDEDVSTVLAAVYVALAVIDIMRGEIRYLTGYMSDLSFRYVCNREAEINVQEHQELTENLITKLKARLEK